jgi:ribosomal-protein-alanine N-acetyltransferase
LTRRIHIARFRPGQLPRLLEIEKAAFGAEAWPRDYFLELYRDCGSLFLVAKLAPRIAGYSLTCIEDGVAEICSVAVDPVCRRQGVARALIARTLRRLPAGVHRAELMVRTGNAAAANLYSSLGFYRIRTVRRYYEDGADGVLMAMAIQ